MNIQQFCIDNNIDAFYDNYQNTIEILLRDKNNDLHIANIELISRGVLNKDVDCCISSFSSNFYIRTLKGMKYQKYKSMSSMLKSVKMVLKKYDFILENIEAFYNKD